MLTQPSVSESTWWTIVRLLRWDKPEGRLILMIPALWALFLAAGGRPDPVLVGVIVLGTLATSAAGCVVNDLWDRDIDPHVKRTQNRPLAARALSVKTGIAVAIVSFICAGMLALYLNPWRNPLSFGLCVGAVPVIVLYPLAKRVFPVPQLVLALAWGFAVLISWSAVSHSLEIPTGLLWMATVLWTLGFDTVYAMGDREDDRRLGVQSGALFFGQYAEVAIVTFFIGTAFFLGWMGIVMHLGLIYWFCLALSTLAWLSQGNELRQPNLPAATYAQLFRQNVWIGFLLLAGMVW